MGPSAISLNAVHDGYTYLDHAATTPMRADAVAAMLPFLTEQFANPSGSHRFARQVRKSIDEARDDVADVLGCRPGEIIFTSGGTEADNTAIFGTLDRRGGIAACPAVEHHAVLHAVESRHGRVVGVDAVGRVDLDALAAALDDVSIVSVMAVNNEVGTITDLAEVAAIVRRAAPRAVLHTDAVQAACWLDLRSITPHVDLMSLSAHKFGGPKGVGVLVARGNSAFAPMLVGGGQERERRSGTHNVAGIIAMAVALRATDNERADENPRVAGLRDTLVDGLQAEVDGIYETVGRDHKVAGSAHVCIDGIENEALLYLLDEADVCASAASSCASGAMEPSHVLAAMGVPNERARGALRLTLGRTTTADDIARATTAISESVRRLRKGRAA
jgi:cysteine desulfurase